MDNPEPVTQPGRQLKGSKLDQSAHRDQIAMMLLMRKGYAACLRHLDAQNFHVDIKTLKEFELNYVSNLSQEARDKLIEAGKKAEDARDATIITQAVHARLSRVESLIQQIEYAEEQLANLDRAITPSTAVMYQRGLWTDRICFLRGKLEGARIESEVEVERGKAVEAVAEIALEYILDSTNAEQFIQRVAAIRDRKP